MDLNFEQMLVGVHSRETRPLPGIGVDLGSWRRKHGVRCHSVVVDRYSCVRERVASAATPVVAGQGDPRLNDEQKAQLAAIGGSDALQDALDAVARQYPELSNE